MREANYSDQHTYPVGICRTWCRTAGSGNGLDIMGSRANNTTIIAPEGMPVEVDIVGSTASNIQIGYPDRSGQRDMWK